MNNIQSTNDWILDNGQVNPLINLIYDIEEVLNDRYYTVVYIREEISINNYELDRHYIIKFKKTNKAVIIKCFGIASIECSLNEGIGYFRANLFFNDLVDLNGGATYDSTVMIDLLGNVYKPGVFTHNIVFDKIFRKLCNIFEIMPNILVLVTSIISVIPLWVIFIADHILYKLLITHHKHKNKIGELI